MNPSRRSCGGSTRACRCHGSGTAPSAAAARGRACTGCPAARRPLPRLVHGAIGGGYPVPRNLNYFWNFGVLAGLFLMIQIVTGIVLAMWYFSSVDGAFNSVEHIMRDVNAGWVLRYAHM